MGERSTKSQKAHGLTGKPSNNRKPKTEQATRNIGFRVTNERWQAYHDAAERGGKNLTRWLVDLADAAVDGKTTQENNE